MSRRPRRAPQGSRILMLVPHDPDADPRVRWVMELAGSLARTDVLATSRSTSKPRTEYDGRVYVERFDDATNSSALARKALPLATRAAASAPARAFERRRGAPGRRGRVKLVYYHLGAALRLASAWGYYLQPISALYRRGRAVHVRPDVIVSHDLYALIPATFLKRRFQCRLLHDTHEFFPYADLLAPPWQARLVRALEQRFIRHADAVVTVSPPLARELERVYGLRSVVSVPNAEPRREAPPPRRERPSDVPTRFLLQGQAAPGRGFEPLLDAWSAQVDGPQAVLQIRCPDSDYVQELRARYGALEAAGRLVWLDPVEESRLVDAAADSDVGVVPYVGPSPNHLYACPNKLSQYMAAGLAIMANDLPYVSELLARYRCGVTYRAEEPASLAAAVERLADASVRRELQENARRAAFESFNWEELSPPYAEALAALLPRSSE